MLSAVDCVKKHFQSQRTEEEAFITVYTSATDLVTSLEIEPIRCHITKATEETCWPSWAPTFHPQIRRSTTVYSSSSPWHCNNTADKRFEQEGLQHLVKLEKVPTLGQVNDVVDLYPELQFQSLKVQLAMFTANYTYKTCSEVTEIMRNMVPEVRGLFCVCARCSCLICWSREKLQCLETPEDPGCGSSMSQTRLNSVAVCHVHRERMYNLDKKKLCQEFVQVTDRRMHVFGHFRISNSFFGLSYFFGNVHCFFLYLNCIACFILWK